MHNSFNDSFLTFEDRLKDIQERIHLARQGAPLASFDTHLMGASKQQDAATIEMAIKTGLHLFGENRVAEAKEKWPQLKALYPSVQLHLIGPLQTNKVRDALRLFDVIESVDREKLVDAIAKEVVSSKLLAVSDRQNESETNNQQLITNSYFIQINTGEEPQKAGVYPKDASALIAYARAAGLNVTGLMCIPPANDYPAPHFALLRDIAIKHNITELSMGMSGDYELAARMGSTIVRVGSALFGSRI